MSIFGYMDCGLLPCMNESRLYAQFILQRYTIKFLDKLNYVYTVARGNWKSAEEERR